MVARRREDDAVTLEDLRDEIRADLRSLGEKVDALSGQVTEIRVDAAAAKAKADAAEISSEARHKSSSSRLSRLESNQRWVVMGVLGAVGMAALKMMGLGDGPGGK